MSIIWNKASIPSALAGLAIGALVIGGIWFGTAQTHPTSSPNPVLAKVGNTKIQQSQLYQQATATGGSQAMMQLIGNNLVQQGAQKYHITASTAEINQALKNIEAQNHITSSAQLKLALASSGLTLSDLMTNIKTQVLEQKLAERNITVTNQEIQSYYNQNKAHLASNGKNPPTLASARNTIIQDIKQSKALSAQVLLADLAKQFPIQIMDKQYQGLKTQIESPASTQTSTSSAP